MLGALALPEPARSLAVLAAVVILGVPHGALDGELARAALRPRLGAAWAIVFALPYLTLAALVLLAWRVAPLPTLAMFLAASAWHFGEEEGGCGVKALALGGLPVVVPVVCHPAATARFLEGVSLVPMPRVPGWLAAGCTAQSCLLALWAANQLLRGSWRGPVAAALIAAPFVLLPPLPAFGLYFVARHAPLHATALIASHAAPRVTDVRSAYALAAPWMLLTLLAGAALWPFFPGAFSDRLLALTFQGLAALTLPHMLLPYALRGRCRPARVASSRMRNISAGIEWL